MERQHIVVGAPGREDDAHANRAEASDCPTIGLADQLVRPDERVVDVDRGQAIVAMIRAEKGLNFVHDAAQ